MPQTQIVEIFLQGAQVVGAAVGDLAVAEAWDRQSVLEDQRVGSLAGHLARAGSGSWPTTSTGAFPVVRLNSRAPGSTSPRSRASRHLRITVPSGNVERTLPLLVTVSSCGCLASAWMRSVRGLAALRWATSSQWPVEGSCGSTTT